MSRRLTFPKTSRLVRPAEFQRVREEGDMLRGIFFSLGFLRAGADGPMRAGFVSSKRIGSAATRNRVRRRLREIIRRHQHAVARGTWIVLVARAAAARASSNALEHEYLRLAKRASILAP